MYYVILTILTLLGRKMGKEDTGGYKICCSCNYIASADLTLCDKTAIASHTGPGCSVMSQHSNPT